MLRSQKMSCFRLETADETVENVMLNLGKQKNIHFEDMNWKSGSSKPFLDNLRRCEALEEKILEFKDIIDVCGNKTSIPENVEEYMERKWTMQKLEQRMILKIKNRSKKNNSKFPGNQNDFEIDSDNKSALPVPPVNLEKNIMFEEIELEIEQNLEELKVLYGRIQNLNNELGNLVLQTDFLKAVKQLKIDSYFKFVGPEDIINLTGGSEAMTNQMSDRADMRYNCYYYTSGVFPKKHLQNLSRLLFRLTKSNAIVQILDFHQISREKRKDMLKKKPIHSGANEFKQDSPVMVLGEPPLNGEELAIFFINIPNSKQLIRRIFKVLQMYEALFLEIPRNDKTQSEIDILGQKILEFRKIIRRSYFNLDAKIRPYYVPTQIKASYNRDFKIDYSGMGNDQSKKKDEIMISRIEELHLLQLGYRMLNMQMNKLRLSSMGGMGSTVYQGLVWVPDRQIDNFRDVCRSLNNSGNHNKITLIPNPQKHNIKAPTYFELNDFTAPFQQIVNTYGVPRYQEINPAIFTIITFPFQFGIMFGDMGHGGVYFLVGIVLLLLNEKYKKHKSLAGLFKVRYLLFLMGLFAFYCGWVYNEFFSIPLKLYDSCYTDVFPHGTEQTLPPNSKMPEFQFQRVSPGCVPSVGFDSVWFKSSQEVSFVNSFKMKLSIIVGVVHMCLGIMMKGLNSFHFKKPLDFFFEFIPQILFMLVTFGYMSAAIIIKWVQNWGDGSGAPSIVSIFINLGEATPANGILWGDAQGNSQTHYQQMFFLIAFICVLLMLIPKPLILTIQYLSKKKNHPHAKEFQEVPSEENNEDPEIEEKLLNEDNQDQQSISDDSIMDTFLDEDAHKDHSPGEIWVDQLIEIIEFVLGSVSNTASYLRLWALSLAHGQLAKVFLTMTLLPGIQSGNILITMCGFPIFLVCTFGVLIMMDAMECFLHTLRLHWVEFQNKFYKGDGISFKPFDLDNQVKAEFERQELIRNEE